MYFQYKLDFTPMMLSASARLPLLPPLEPFTVQTGFRPAVNSFRFPPELFFFVLFSKYCDLQFEPLQTLLTFVFILRSAPNQPSHYISVVKNWAVRLPIVSSDLMFMYVHFIGSVYCVDESHISHWGA